MKWLKSLYVQVLIGIALGVLLGIVKPDLGASLEPLGQAFVSAVKMPSALFSHHGPRLCRGPWHGSPNDCRWVPRALV